MSDVDAVKESLIEFFEEMLANKKKFKKKTLRRGDRGCQEKTCRHDKYDGRML